MKEIKIIRYCPNCADQGVSVSEGVNGSDFIKCEKCGLSVNVFWPEVKECDCEGAAEGRHEPECR